MGSHTDEPARKFSQSERLRDISATLPANTVPAPRGSGYRQWETKRANAFRHACADLMRGTAPLDELQRAAAIVSEYIAARVSGEELPRGYSIIVNGGAERALARREVLFGPWYSEPLPDSIALAKLGRDLQTGWLAEIEKALGRALT